MKHEEALEHGLGYAAGREDGSGTRTVGAPGKAQQLGWMDFAHAYAKGWDEYNAGQRGMMIPAKDAYNNWQASGGTRIWAEGVCPVCGSGMWDYNGDGLAQDDRGHTWDQPPAIPGTFVRPGYAGDINDPDRYPPDEEPPTSDPDELAAADQPVPPEMSPWTEGEL